MIPVIPKRFNVAGPCVPDRHYMLPAVDRLPEARRLIEQKRYFVIHAARQSGKTTLLRALTREINAAGRQYALYCSLEELQEVTELAAVMKSVVGKIQLAGEYSPAERLLSGLTPPR
ncbi:MAG: ATP-binding protein, partial [Planctomycetota bacterium]|nr:ATP-binding protein [Planctomycetota bacterium]